MLSIRDAEINELEQIMKIYEHAQDFMIETGNPTQWEHVYPTVALIKNDIEQGACRVVFDDSGIHGVVALFNGIEPTYVRIEDGEWLNDEPYITNHRVASDGEAHGIFQCVVDYCKNNFRNIRIDTHEDNRIMQSLIQKNEFMECGIIYFEDGTPRIAYQWCSD